MKSLTQTIPNYVAACFSGLWIETQEPYEAVREINEICREREWNMAVWDIDVGLQGSKSAPDPLSAVKTLSQLSDNKKPFLLVLRNYHRFLGSIEIVQALERQIQYGKQNRGYVVVLAPVVQIPPELEKLFAVLEHPLPDREQLRELAADVIRQPPDDTEDGKNYIVEELPDEPNTDRILDAAAGMTRLEAEGAFALSIIEHGCLKPDTIWELKANMLRQSSALRLYRGEIPSIGGLENMTNFCRGALLSGKGKARGVMVLGVSGSGKSAFCKRLGYSVQRPTLVLDIGALMGSLVGQTEAALRKALNQVDVMEPCVVMIDEVEKAISTSGNDGGVSARMLGTLLSWLNDHRSDVFVVCTANDISKLPPEFTRAERFDGIFFVDLPDKETRDAIWPIYLSEYDLPEQARPKDDDWTGAEIKACCRLANLLDMPLIDAALNVVPVAATAGESIQSLRTWASGRCLDANRPGIYRYGETDTTVDRPRCRRNLAGNGKDALSDALRTGS